MEIRAMNDAGNWIEHYRAGGVIFGEFRHGAPNAGNEAYFVVADENFHHYRLTFSCDGDGDCRVGINAEWSDDRRGELADFTPSYEYGNDLVKLEDVTISDDGLLSVMGRSRFSASHVDVRRGFTAKLPTSFVTPIRQVLAMLQKDRS
jgi:hypothetical protein